MRISDARSCFIIIAALLSTGGGSAYAVPMEAVPPPARSPLNWLEVGQHLRADLNSAEEFELAGLALLQTSRPSEAEARFREALRLEPNRMSARSKLGAALLVQDKLAGAEIQLRSVLQADPADFVTHYYMGWLNQRRGQVSTAIEHFQSYFRLRRPPAGQLEVAHVALAELLTLEQQHEAVVEALTPLTPAASTDPLITTANLILISSSIELRRLPEAEQRLAALKRSQPGQSPQLKIAEAMLARAQGAIDRSRALLNQALQEAPALAPAIYYKLAQTEMAAGRAEAAAANLEAAISKVSPEELPVLLRDLSSVLVQSKQAPRAVQILSTAANQHPEQPWIRYLLAEVLISQGDLQRGGAALNQVIGDQPEFAPAHYLAGVIGWNANRRPEARRAFERATTLAPGDVRAWLALAGSHDTQEGRGQMQAVLVQALKANVDHPSLLYESAVLDYEAGQIVEANAKYRKILANYPDNVPAMNNLAVGLAETRQTLPEARALAKKAHDRAGTNPTVQDTYGWILFLSGDANAALPLIEQAAAKQQDDASIHYHLGTVYLDRGRRTDAKRHLEKAAELGVPAPLQAALQSALRRAN